MMESTLKEISAEITYIDRVTGESWTRGEEHWLGHSEFGAYLWRNADRVAKVKLLSVGKVVY